MARHLDFDAAWEALSASQAAPTITIASQTVTLPKDKPVALVLLGHQLRDPDTRRDVTLTRLLEVLSIVVGAEIVEQWVAEGIGFEQLAAFAAILQGMWAKEDDEGQGEAQPPATGANAS